MQIITYIGKPDLEIMLPNIGKIFLNIDFNIHSYRKKNYIKIQCQVYKYRGRPRKWTTIVEAHLRRALFVLFNTEEQ